MFLGKVIAHTSLWFSNFFPVLLMLLVTDVTRWKYSINFQLENLDWYKKFQIFSYAMASKSRDGTALSNVPTVFGILKLNSFIYVVLENKILWNFRTAQCQQQRGMANLKAIGLRLKSVKNIQKITQSMKMVSAAKYARAEQDLKAARPLGKAAQKFYEQAEVGKKLKHNHPACVPLIYLVLNIIIIAC